MRGVEGGLASKGQSDRGCTNDSGSCTKLCHEDASVTVLSTTAVGSSVKWTEVGQAGGGRSWKQRPQRRRDMSKQRKGRRRGSLGRGQEERQGSYRWNRFHSRWEASRRGKLSRRGACDDAIRIMACQGAGGLRDARCTAE